MTEFSLARRSPRGQRLLASLAAAAFTLGGCAHKAAPATHTRGDRGAPAPAPVATTTASTTTVYPTLTLAGIIAPYQSVAITASLSEPTAQVFVNEGDVVRAGETLAIQDVTDLKANLAAAESTAQSDVARIAQTKYTATLNYGQVPDAVRQAQAALTQAQQTLAQAQVDLQRDRQLAASGYISTQQLDQQTTAVANDAAAVRSAQAGVSSQLTNARVNGNPQQGLQAANVSAAQSTAESAQAQADQLRAQIARAVIVSPIDGIVVNRNLNPGEYPGGRTNFTIQELSRVYATLNASSSDVFQIRRGATARVTASGDPSAHIYRGSVVGVLGQVQPGSTNFTVKALLANPGYHLQSGVPVTAVISLPTVSGVGVPATAFLDDSHTSIVVEQGGTARVTHVRELATANGKSVVNGLHSGASVVADGQLGLANGQKLSRE